MAPRKKMLKLDNVCWLVIIDELVKRGLVHIVRDIFLLSALNVEAMSQTALVSPQSWWIVWDSESWVERYFTTLGHMKGMPLLKMMYFKRRVQHSIRAACEQVIPVSVFKQACCDYRQLKEARCATGARFICSVFTILPAAATCCYYCAGQGDDDGVTCYRLLKWDVVECATSDELMAVHSTNKEHNRHCLSIYCRRTMKLLQAFGINGELRRFVLPGSNSTSVILALYKKFYGELASFLVALNLSNGKVRTLGYQVFHHNYGYITYDEELRRERHLIVHYVKKTADNALNVVLVTVYKENDVSDGSFERIVHNQQFILNSVRHLASNDDCDYFCISGSISSSVDVLRVHKLRSKHDFRVLTKELDIGGFLSPAVGIYGRFPPVPVRRDSYLFVKHCFAFVIDSSKVKIEAKTLERTGKVVHAFYLNNDGKNKRNNKVVSATVKGTFLVATGTRSTIVWKLPNDFYDTWCSAASHWNKRARIPESRPFAVMNNDPDTYSPSNNASDVHVDGNFVSQVLVNKKSKSVDLRFCYFD